MLITISVRGDLILEGNETFTVTISNASYGTLADVTTTGTILDNEGGSSSGGGGGSGGNGSTCSAKPSFRTLVSGRSLTVTGDPKVKGTCTVVSESWDFGDRASAADVSTENVADYTYSAKGKLLVYRVELSNGKSYSAKKKVAIR